MILVKQADESVDEDGKNTDAAVNGTEKNDDFLRDVHQDSEIKDEDFGATTNIEQGRLASGRQVNPHVKNISISSHDYN